MAHSRRAGQRHVAGSHPGHHPRGTTNRPPAAATNLSSHNPYNAYNGSSSYSAYSALSHHSRAPGAGLGAGLGADFGAGMLQPPPYQEHAQHDTESGNNHGQQQQQQQQQQAGPSPRPKSKHQRRPPRLELAEPPRQAALEPQTPAPDEHDAAGALSPMDAQTPARRPGSHAPLPSPGPGPHAPETAMHRGQLPRSPLGAPDAMPRGGGYQPHQVPSSLRPPAPGNYAAPPHGGQFMSQGVMNQGVTNQGVTNQGVTNQGVTNQGLTSQGPPPPAYDVASPPPYSHHNPYRQSAGKLAVPTGGRGGVGGVGRGGPGPGAASRPVSPRGEQPSGGAGVPDDPKPAPSPPPTPAPEATPRSGGGASSSRNHKKIAYVIVGIVVLVLLGVGIYYLVKHTEHAFGGGGSGRGSGSGSGGGSSGGGGGGSSSSGGTVDSSSSEDAPLPGDGEKHTGDITYYDTGLGSCGQTSTNDDPICAISHVTYDAAQQGGNPNTNPLCGKKIRIERNGRTVDVTVVDRCEACQANDLDLAPAVFEQLADMSQGRVQATWAWLDN